MIRIFQFLALLSVAALIYISYAKKEETDARALRVKELAECFHREDFHRHASPKTVQKAFLRAIYLLHQNVKEEPPPRMWQDVRPDVHWYLDEALKDFPAPDNELSLIKSSLLNALSDAQRLGLLSDPVSRDQLAKGELPLIASGPFEGEPLRIGWHISPVLIPEVVNHMANFVLQPALAWGVQQDRMDDTSFATAKRFYAAGVLSNEGFALAQSYHEASRTSK